MPPHARRLVLTALLAVGLLALVAPCVAAARPAAQAQPLVVGGSTTTIVATPWQVFLRIGGQIACGGSILDATHVLTAAHCLTGDGAFAPAAPADIMVLAGADNVAGWAQGQAAPPGAQVAGVASLRVHPFFDQATWTDDVMVLSLARSLDLSTPRVKAIALAPAGSAVAPGTPVRVTGYGQSSATTMALDGALRTADLTAISDDDCRSMQNGNSAVVLCAQAPSATICHGDSGGPLTTTTQPPAQVGVVSFAVADNCAPGAGGFADVAAPEVRAFIDGAAVIPRAPRQQSPAVISGVAVPVVGSPLTCSPGAWDGAPALTYTFLAGAAAVQSGPSATYAPRAADVRQSITCVVQAAGAGGTSTERSGTAPPVGPDAVAPRSAITAERCRSRTCRFSVHAADPNSLGLVSLRATASYAVVVACRRHGHRAHCRRTRYRHLAVAQTSPGRFATTAANLPRHHRVRFAFAAIDAAGNQQRPALTAGFHVR